MAEETTESNFQMMMGIARACQAMVELYGIVRAEDAYVRYLTWYGSTIPSDEFAGVVYSAANSGKFAFRIWSSADRDYLCHVTLTEESKQFTAGDNDHYSMSEYRSHLIEQHEKIPMADLPSDPARIGALFWKMQQPGVVRLRAHLLSYAPEGIDANAFADDLVRDLLSASLVAYDEKAADLMLTTHGVTAHAKVGDPTMGLIAVALDDLPCWEYNGRSPRQQREAMGEGK